jgi:hypothetical protein
LTEVARSPPSSFEVSKAQSGALDAFRRLPEVSKWLTEISGGEFNVENGVVACTGSKKTYSGVLFRYWTVSLSKTYSTLKDWIEAIRLQGSRWKTSKNQTHRAARADQPRQRATRTNQSPRSAMVHGPSRPRA